MLTLVNRDNELRFLENEYQANRSSFIVVYGKPRVGKTALISKFLESHPDSLYFLASVESEVQNLNAFKAQVAKLTGNSLMNNDWTAFFQTLTDFPTKTKKIIVIDDFPNLAKSNPAFPSILQKAWDTRLERSNVMLILSGSPIPLMRKLALDYSSPLYGRRTGQIRLRQIPFRYYHEFFDGRSDDELIPFYAVTGGVPKYIESFLGYKDIYQGIEGKILDADSFLYEEPYFLLQKEVTEIGSYFSLLKTIALGKRKLSEIASYLGLKQTNLPKYLKVLMDLDLIEREVPVTETFPEKSKNGLYRLTDNFLAFWFRFIYPNRPFVEKGESSYVLSEIKKGFIQNHVSYVYEDVCREKVWEFSFAHAWTFPIVKVGRYWGPLCGETDIVALDDSGHNLVVGECKYSSSPKGINVLRALQEKGEALRRYTNADHVEYILFNKGGFTVELAKEANDNPTIKLIERL